MRRASPLASIALALSVLAIVATVFLAKSSESSITSETRAHFTETDITENGRQANHYIPDSTASCVIYGTWDGARATMETDIHGTPDALPVGPPALDAATFDTGFITFSVGSGTYRLVTSQVGLSTSLKFHCRWVR